MQIIKFIIFLILPLFSIPIMSEEIELKNVDQYLKEAALNNQELEESFYKWKAALFKINRVKGLPDPKLTYTHFIENVETRVGPQEKNYGLVQMFPWFGKLSTQGDIAQEEANALEQNYQEKKLSLFFKIKSVYSDYYFLAKSRETTKENIELVKYFERVARTKYKSGKASHAAVIQAQIELAKLQDKYQSLSELRMPMISKINAILNRPTDKQIPWPQTIPESQIELNESIITQQLLNKNPSLNALKHQLKKEEKSITLSKKNYLPDFSIGANYIETGKSKMSGITDNGKDPISVSVSINIPIWFGKYSAGVQESVNNHLSVSKKRAQETNNLLSELKMSIYKYRDAKRKINLYRETLIPKSKQSLKVTQQTFETGRVDFLNLIDAQRTLLEMELLYQQSLSEKYKYLAQIEMLTGENI